MEEEAKLGSKKSARLHKSFFHFSEALKKLQRHGHASSDDKPSSSSAAAANTTTNTSFLSACMHPRTYSFASDGRRRHVAGDDDGAHLAVNFRSLRIGPTVVVDSHDGSSSHDYGYCESEGGGAAAGAAKAMAGGSGGVAVTTFSAAPYEDFRRSMLEMVSVHARREAVASVRAAPVVDWDFMEELLFCYLQLNDRAVHKHILQAFTDTVAALRRRRRAPAPAPKPKSRRTRRQRRNNEDAVDDDLKDAVDSS